MRTEIEKSNDAEVIALAQAEREAGVPDQQTAAAAAEAKARLSKDDAEVEAHPS